MYTYIYTKSLDNASDMVTKALDFEKKSDAIDLFNDRVKHLVDEALNNELLNFKISMHNYKAIVKIESTHHCVAVVKDGGLVQDE